MDEWSAFRVLSGEEFLRLTSDEKLAYLNEAINILMSSRHRTSSSAAVESDPEPDEG